MAEGPTSKTPMSKSGKPVAPIARPKSAPVLPPLAQVPVGDTTVVPPFANAKPVVSQVPVVPVAQAHPIVAAPVMPVTITAPVEDPVKVEMSTQTPVAAPVASTQKGTTMNDTVNTAQATIKNAAEDMQTRATAAFGDMNVRAKDAMSKGTKAIEELVEFSKGNLEAMATSGRVAAKGAEEIAKYSAEYGRAAIERANATAKQFAAVKSPTEFFQLQGDVAKQTLDALVAEGSKFTENYLKLLGEIAQPMSNRYAVAAEKVKSSDAA